MMGQDARSTGVGLGLLCKHTARNEAQPGLGLEVYVQGQSVALRARVCMYLRVCPRVLTAASSCLCAWGDLYDCWYMCFHACFHALEFYFKQLPMHLCASVSIFQRDA